MHVVGIHSSVESMRFDWEGAAKFEELLKKKLKKKTGNEEEEEASIVDLTFDPAKEEEAKKEATEKKNKEAEKGTMLKTPDGGKGPMLKKSVGGMKTPAAMIKGKAQSEQIDMPIMEMLDMSVEDKLSKTLSTSSFGLPPSVGGKPKLDVESVGELFWNYLVTQP